MDDSSPRRLPELPPPDYVDPVVEYYMQFVDRAVLRENLKLSVEERIRRAEERHRLQDREREARRRQEEEQGS